MNKNFKAIVAAATLVLGAGCVHAGTWVNGYYIDGPLCTVCDGMRVIRHTYGATVCAHCDGTGIEPPEVPVVSTVVIDGWYPPPPRAHVRHRRPAPPPQRHPHVARRNPPPRQDGHRGGKPHASRPAPHAAPRGGTHRGKRR